MKACDITQKYYQKHIYDFENKTPPSVLVVAPDGVDPQGEQTLEIPCWVPEHKTGFWPADTVARFIKHNTSLLRLF